MKKVTFLLMYEISNDLLTEFIVYNIIVVTSLPHCIIFFNLKIFTPLTLLESCVYPLG